MKDSQPLSETDDHGLWAAVVAAQTELAARRADFHQHARSPGPILAQALSGPPSEQAAALRFLAVSRYLSDHLELLPALIELALSHRWAAYARQAIGAARRDHLIPAMRQLVLPLLENADCDDYRRLAELLAHVQAWELLGELIRRALTSADADMREVGEDFTSSYGPLWQAR
jgi:hypothetical protein